MYYGPTFTNNQKERSENMSKKSIAERGLFRRRGSPYWCIRYADRNGRIHRKSTGTNSKRLAREILAKHKSLVAENRHLDVKKVPKTTFYELCDQYWELGDEPQLIGK